MNIKQHGDNLWQLTRLFAFNCYLVREADGFTLIDTNMAGSATGILKAAAKLDLPVRRVTLTHAHGDHAGSLDEISVALPDVEVALTARTAAFLRGEMTLHSDEPQAKLRGGWVIRQTPPTRLLTPGDRIGSLRVVAAPGHTPDLVAFFDERDGTLIAGDAFHTQAGTAVSGTMRWLFPFPAMATWHQPTAIRSAMALRQLNPTRLAVGHGAVLENPTEQMEAAIHEAEAKLDPVEQISNAG